ncbi:MAG: 30S ribosomal protein S6 [Acidobacteriota bacterium]
MDRHYETLWIASGALTQEEADGLATEFEGIVRGSQGTISAIDKQGKRRLAYPIKGQREGYYTLFTIEGQPAVILELERKMRLHEQVIRYQTVKMDEEVKRKEKVAARRKEKKERRAQRGAAERPERQDGVTPLVKRDEDLD